MGAGASGVGLGVGKARGCDAALRHLAGHAQLLCKHQQGRLGGLPHSAVVAGLELDAGVVAERAHLGQRLHMRGGASSKHAKR